MKRVLCIAGLGVVLTACGPVDYLSTVTLKASKAVSEARTSDAERLAPYEYWSAVTYLQMAREVAAYADYEDAIDYGDKAVDMANKAKNLAIDKGQEGPSASRDTQAPAKVVPGGANGTVSEPDKGDQP